MVYENVQHGTENETCAVPVSDVILAGITGGAIWIWSRSLFNDTHLLALYSDECRIIRESVRNLKDLFPVEV